MRRENPFSPSFPVNPRYFVNREEVVDSFKKAFDRSTKTEFPTPDNIAILGDWGIGKTSVLRKFESIAIEEFRERKAFSTIAELIPTACNSFASFTAKVIDDVDRNFNVQASILTRIRSEIRNWRIKSVGIGGVELERAKVKSDAAAFKDALIDLWKILEKSGIDTALLMLDDLHYLSERYPDGLYDLRGVFQGLPRHGCNFILCTTGKRELFSEIRELAEPLGRFFNIKHALKPFDLGETAKAIRKPIRLSGLNLTLEDGVISRIHELTAGHPFFIHFIMRELVSLKEEGTIDLRYFDENYPSIERIMEREKFEVDFSIASEKERRILLEMAGLPERFAPSDIKIKNARTQLRFLLKKNLIIRHDRGEYSLYHPLFKGFLGGFKVT
ncbi:MAG: hypothetical protein ACE5PM_04635 [Candidatus Hydrothermarchaeales archaeon]